MNVNCQLSFKQCSNVHQLQQHTIEVSYEMIGLPYQWTPVANHSISPTKQSLARQCWSAFVCIADSVPALWPIHDNQVDWDLANSVAILLFQWKQGNSSGPNLAQELLCELGLRLVERRSCRTGDVCSLWSDLATAWQSSNWRSLWPFRWQSELDPFRHSKKKLRQTPSNVGQTLHVQLTDASCRRSSSFRPNAIILVVHWRIDVEIFLISKENPLCLINSQSSEQSFGTLESFLFHRLR